MKLTTWVKVRLCLLSIGMTLGDFKALFTVGINVHLSDAFTSRQLKCIAVYIWHLNSSPLNTCDWISCIISATRKESPHLSGTLVCHCICSSGRNVLKCEP